MSKVSVIIVSYNVRSYIAHSIESIISSNYENIEIIVIDNNSYDGTCDYLKNEYNDKCDIKIIRNKNNIGFGKAINKAAKIANGDYFFILNPDTIIEENTISILLDYLIENSSIAMIGPKILNGDGTLQLSCKRSFPTLRSALPRLLGLDRIFPQTKWAGKYNLTYLDPDKVHAVDAISGSCMFIKSNAFYKVNGFDEDYFMFGEDIDLCKRLWKNGLEIHYVPKTKIIHYKGKSVDTATYDSREAFYDAMSIYVNKHYSSTMSILTRLFVALGIRIRKLISTLSEKKSLIVSLTFDFSIISGAFIIGMNFRFDNYIPVILSNGLVPSVYVILWILVGSFFQLYSRYILSYSRAFMAAITGFMIAVLFTYFFKQYAYSRLMIIIASSIIILIIPGWRVLFHYLISRGYFRNVNHSKSIIFSRKAIVAGTDKEGMRIAKNILKRFDSGLDITGFVDFKYPENDELSIPYIGNIKDIRQICKNNKIREIIFSTTSFSYQDIIDFMDKTKDLRLIYRMVPKKKDILLGNSNIENIGGISFLNIEYNIYHKMNRLSKRVFDLITSTFFIILFSPFIFSYNIFGRKIKMDCWGMNNSSLSVIVFDSKNEFIRDLPLLFSVFLGKISLVGSPMISVEQKDPNLLCLPGITGLERIRNVKFDSNTRQAVEHYYVQNQNIKLDLEIIIKTILNG